jgi:hypothetical protein
MDFPSPNPTQQPPNLPIPPPNQRNYFDHTNSIDQYIMDHQRSSERMEECEINGWSCCHEIIGGMLWGECSADIGFMGAERTGWRSGLVFE